MAEASAAAPLCLPPRPLDRPPRVALPAGTCDCHFHVFREGLPLAAERGYTPTHGDARRLARASPPPSASRAASSCSRASTAPTTASCSRRWPRIPTRLRGVVVIPPDTARGRDRPPAPARRARRPDQPARTGPGSPSTRSPTSRAWSARSAGTCSSWSAPSRSPTVAGARGAAGDARRHRPPRPDPARRRRVRRGRHRTAAPPRHRRRLRQALGPLPAGAGARLPRPRPAGRAPGPEPSRAAALGHRLAAHRPLRQRARRRGPGRHRPRLAPRRRRCAQRVLVANPQALYWAA